MNVLVYSGPGVSSASLTHTLSSLRTALSTAYAVQPILAQALTNEPWASTCALLVIPGGRDLPYVSSLAPAISKIKDYVRGGGKFMGLCAGAYFACERCDFEVGTALEVSGKRDLGFFPGTCEGCTYPGFAYESEEGARAVSINLPRPAWENQTEVPSTVDGIYYNGGGHFIPNSSSAVSSGLVTVIAQYANPPSPSHSTAAVLCRVGKGLALLSGPHIEYPLPQEPARSALEKTLPNSTLQQRADWEALRLNIFLSSLRLLGLQPPPLPPSTAPPLPRTPLPQFLLCSPARPDLPTRAKQALESIVEPQDSDGPPEVRDANDTFHIHPSSSTSSLLLEARTRFIDESFERDLHVPEDFPKMIIVYPDGSLPDKNDTPVFDLEAYFKELEHARERKGLKERDERDPGKSWGMGQLMLYGEVVTSTQTMLDRNPKILSTVPTPLLSLASYQLSGRGRGGNLWISPTGCLQHSLHIRPPSNISGGKLVFVQYLYGLAVVEACREVLSSFREEGRKAADRIRLKWPNDIYGIVEGGEKKKLGGVLVSTNYLKGRAEVVIGCGLNVLNTVPTTSLKYLLELSGSPHADELDLERVMATILPTFDSMWTRFLLNRGDFRPFLDLYLSRWLHSDQVVTLTTVTPPVAVRITGITLDYGLLRTVPAERDPWKTSTRQEFIDLQPDGNSFDMISGLIKKKV